jgi:multiple sugar transport system ATP-binding protein
MSNLDSGLRAQLRAEIRSFVREFGVTTIYVTHDQVEAHTMADRVAILRRGVLQAVGSPTEIYRRPGTAFVATFLGSPKMNLVQAQVRAHLDRDVALHVGEQALCLPWSDMRARQVAHFHGEKIVVGFRAEALTPIVSDAQGDVLHGTVQYIEHHGHESLAYIDVGAIAINIDDHNPSARTDAHTGRGGRVAGMFRRAAPADGADQGSGHANSASHGNGRTQGNGLVDVDQAPTRTRAAAELAVRLQPYPALRVGEQMSVLVQLDQLHFFDTLGNRIDLGPAVTR